MLNDFSPTYSVLLIEDSVIYTRLVEEMLANSRRAQFSLSCAGSLAGGLAQAHTNPPDVILLDLLLPDSRGLATFDAVFSALPDIPVVVLSSLDDENLAVRAVRQGAQDYLIKGQTDAQLLSRALIYAIERMYAARALQQEKNSLQALFDNIEYALLILDDEAHLHGVNPAACMMTGYSGEVMQRLTLRDLMPPMTQELSQEIWKQFIRDGRYLGDFLILCGDGRTIICECSARANFLPGRHLMLLYDVSERKRTEGALRESEQRFRDFMDNAQDGFVLVDENGLILLWNPAMQRITQMPVGAVIGKTIWEVQAAMSPPEQRSPQLDEGIAEFYKNVLQSGQISHYSQGRVMEIANAAGERRFVHAEMFTIKTRRGYRIGSMVRDVTEQRQLEESVHSSLRRADLSALVAALLYPFQETSRTITAAAGRMEQLLRQPEMERACLEEELAAIMRSGQACRSVMNSLADYVRLHLTEKKPHSVSSLVDAALLQAEAGQPDAALQIELHIAPHLPPLACDANRMVQALAGLFSLNPGSGLDRRSQSAPRLKIASEFHHEKNQLVLRAAYSHLDADLRNALDPEQPNLAFTSGHPGGLELSVICGIVCSHGGTLQIEHPAGGGTAITLTFPV